MTFLLTFSPLFSSFSGALVGVLDVISCLVLDSGRKETEEQNKTVKSKPPMSSDNLEPAAFKSKLAGIFSKYTNSISYAIEMCAVSARSAIQDIAFTKTKTCPDPQERPSDKDKEPLSHLVHMMTVCKNCEKESSSECSSFGRPSLVLINLF